MDTQILNNDDEIYEVPPKKIKTEWSKSYSNVAMTMMCRMGYEKDKGLGRLNQGRLEPIVAVTQDGRKGLGLRSEEGDTDTLEWDFDAEQLQIPEPVVWLSNQSNHFLSNADFQNWLKLGEKKLTLDDEHEFCDAEVLEQVLQAKTVFDTLDDSDVRKARTRSNPFETIRSSIFLNRAAVKMANMDSMTDYMFTEPKDQFNNSLLHENELLYFADICAGPGGFSEYVLFRKGWKAKGFGFTLRGANDFKLEKFSAGSPESFDAYYGVKDDGDIYDENNQNSLADYIFKHTREGVHFVMADGGFSVDGQENIQEILSKRLYLCQFLTSLKILRENGSFVCKLFDLFTPFSVGLVYLMYKCFQQISIIKPNSSRPANSERYIVCKWKNANAKKVCNYLNLINKLLSQEDEEDVIEIVSIDEMRSDEHFYNYIVDSNNAIGINQIMGLKKIYTFYKNVQLKETRQATIRKQCLEIWNLPDKLRQAPEAKTVDKLLEEIMADWYEHRSLLSVPATEANKQTLPHLIKSVHDWYFVPIGRAETSINTCSIFLCKSRGNLLRYTDSKRWEPVEYHFEVSPRSLFYGEIVYEFSGEGRTLTRVCGLHIIDAIMLGGVDIRRYGLRQRFRLCEKFSLSINKPFKDGNFGCIRSKPVFKLLEINDFFQQMRHYCLKDNSQRLGLSLSDDGKFFVPGGILIFCEIVHECYSKMSRSRGMLYYIHTNRKMSYFIDDMPPDVKTSLYASFRNSFQRRIIWKWTNTMQVQENSEKPEENLLYRDDLQEFIMQNLNS